jgi:hypothetical protein
VSRVTSKTEDPRGPHSGHAPRRPRQQAVPIAWSVPTSALVRPALLVGWILSVVTVLIAFQLQGGWYEYALMGRADRRWAVNMNGWEVIREVEKDGALVFTYYLRRPRLRPGAAPDLVATSAPKPAARP